MNTMLKLEFQQRARRTTTEITESVPPVSWDLHGTVQYIDPRKCNERMLEMMLWAYEQGKNPRLPSQTPQLSAIADELITFGSKYQGKRFSEVDPRELRRYADWVALNARISTFDTLSAEARDFIEKVDAYLGSTA